jgi:hypothetical protein
MHHQSKLMLLPSEKGLHPATLQHGIFLTVPLRVNLRRLKSPSSINYDWRLLKWTVCLWLGEEGTFVAKCTLHKN